MERRLSAIFAADMVGYSRLMEADEVGTIQRQKVHRAELFDPALIEFHGRIVKEMGDGVLVEFPSVVESVQCAVIIQQGMVDREANVSDDLRIQYRIGINLGDIVIEGDDIFGDGVNITARLEQMAEPGGICISGTTYDQLKSKVEVGYESLGDVQVKNIKRAVRVYRVLTDPDKIGETIGDNRAWLVISRRFAAIAAVLLVAIFAGGGWWWSQQPDFEPVKPAQMALELPKEPSIAVLPFDYLGADKSDNEYLADGLSENITAYLAQLPNMLVIARNSSFTFKGKAVDVREVSKQFGVRYVLEGSIQKTGDKLRITAQLIDAVAGKHLWAETYDRNTDEIFAIQDEITLAIIRNIHGKTIAGKQTFRHSTTNLAAFIEYQKGFASLLKFTPDALKQARIHFGKAFELDPNYSDAIGVTGFTHLMDARLGFAKDPRVSIKLAEQFTNRALEIDNNNPLAISQMSMTRLIQKRGEEARKLAMRSIELAPNDPDIISYAAFVLRNVGEAKKAISYFTKAKRLQPVHPYWLIFDEYVAHIDAEEFEAALKLTDKFLEGLPESAKIGGYLLPAIIHWKTGNKDRAKGLIEKIFKLKPDYSLVEAQQYNSTYIDQSIPERKYAVWRELGIPDNPPLKLPDKPSIAVLPFANMSNDKEQEYFVDGMTDDLITRLANVSGMFVIARNSVFTYKGKNVKVQDVGRDLGVRYVLEGSVRRAGGKLRINAQLIDAKTGGHLWAEIFDRDASDVFALQDEVAAKIVEALKVTLSPYEKQRIANVPTTNMAAYDFYLRGWTLYRLKSAEAYEEALGYLKKAVDLDPSFSEAYAAIALIYWEGGVERTWFLHIGVKGQAEAISKMKMYHKLASSSPTPLYYVVDAEIRRYHHDYEGAIEAANKAIELDPNFSEGHMSLALNFVFAGLTEKARQTAEQALRIDPRYPANYHQIVGFSHFVDENYELAVKSLTEAIRFNPSNEFTVAVLIAAYGQLRKKDQAKPIISMIDSEHERHGRPPMYAGMAYLFPFEDQSVNKRLYYGLRLAGVPNPKVIYADELGQQLTADEIKSLFIPSVISGVRFDASSEAMVPYVWTLKKDGSMVYSENEMPTSGRYRFEGDKLCHIWGCAAYYRLTKKAAEIWQSQYVDIEENGNRLYIKSIKMLSK